MECIYNMQFKVMGFVIIQKYFMCRLNRKLRPPPTYFTLTIQLQFITKPSSKTNSFIIKVEMNHIMVEYLPTDNSEINTTDFFHDMIIQFIYFEKFC